MDYVRQTIGSAALSSIVNLPPALRDKNVEIIVLPLEDGKPEKQDFSCKLGFMPGPPVPDSFFEPLPEEELKLWGL
jgi:hypothetical protein